MNSKSNQKPRAYNHIQCDYRAPRNHTTLPDRSTKAPRHQVVFHIYVLSTQFSIIADIGNLYIQRHNYMVPRQVLRACMLSKYGCGAALFWDSCWRVVCGRMTKLNKVDAGVSWRCKCAFAKRSALLYKLIPLGAHTWRQRILDATRKLPVLIDYLPEYIYMLSDIFHKMIPLELKVWLFAWKLWDFADFVLCNCFKYKSHCKRFRVNPHNVLKGKIAQTTPSCIIVGETE